MNVKIQEYTEFAQGVYSGAEERADGDGVRRVLV